MANALVFTNGGDDVGKITTQRGFATRETDFFRAKLRKRTRDAAHFPDGKKSVIGDAARLIAVWQAIGATKIAHIGNRQT
ncbi:hypothetical protein D3C72_1254760 [compost metagenome]